MTPFSLELPRAIHFGPGTLEKLSSVVRGLGNRILLLSGSRWLSSSSWEARIMAACEGCEVKRACCAPSEPGVRSLDALRQKAAGFNPEVIVAVGGGSVLDTAKALSVLLRFPGPAERFLEGVKGSVPIPGPGIPWVAVPTTAGTGAEVTKNAVVKSETLGLKRSMRSAHLLASAVIVDPLLTVSLPLHTTGTSGLDALTQLVEAYVSRGANPVVRSMVEGAFRPMLTALAGLALDPSDATLRAGASYGAMVSGIALANAGLGAAHGFAAAVGGMFDVPHGLACAVFLPHVLAANAAVIRGDIGRLLDEPPAAGAAAADPVERLAGEVQRLLSLYGLPADLRGFGIPPRSIPELAEKSSGTSMRGNPRDLSTDERIAILARVI